MQQSDAMGLIVISEVDANKTLLVHKIKSDSSDGDVYQRAGGEPASQPASLHQPRCAPRHMAACVTKYWTVNL